jgi:3-deoxy-D-manno-octulosonic-acid transferase
MENFAEIAGAFLSNGAAVQVRTARELEDVVVSLMADPVRRARLGAAARALIDANRGAKDKTLTVLADLVPPPRDPGSVVRPFRVIH